MRPVARLLTLCVALSGSAAPVSAQTPTPESVIVNLYAHYGIGDSGATGFNEKVAGQLFDASLMKLYRAAIKAGAIDSDYFVQGQDFELKKPIEITGSSVTGDKARVSATLTQDFSGGGKSEVSENKFVFSLVREGGGWRIDDAMTGKSSFRREMAEDMKAGN
jgi:hypothetical protein